MTPEQIEALAQRSEARMSRKLGGSGYVPAAISAASSDEDDDETQDPTSARAAGTGGDAGNEGNPRERSGREISEALGSGNGAHEDGDDAAAVRAELARLKQDLAAQTGRNVPLQRDVETYRQLTAELQRKVDAQQKELEALAAARPAPEFDMTTVLSKEEIDDIDPTVLKTMAKLAGAMAQHSLGQGGVEAQVRKELERRQAEELKDYREQALISRDLSDIVTLKTDPRFLAWVEQDDNEIESTVTMLLNASNKASIDKYARLLKRKVDAFKASLTASPNSRPASDANTTLAAGMRRGNKASPTQAEVAAQLEKARRLARSRNAADRKKAQDIITALGG